MHEEASLDAAAVLEHRLAIAVRVFGWGAERVAGFRAGLADPDPDRDRLGRHLPDDGYDEGALSPGEREALGYGEGAAAREAARMPPSDLPGADALVLLEAAAFWADNGDGGFEVDEAEWRCDAAGPLEPFLTVMDREAWGRWLLAEHAAAVEAGRPGYAHLVLQDIRDPVVCVERPDGSVDVWDGWHRVAAAMLKGAGSIPVLAGTPPAPSPAP